ncbi:MAG: S9 family peptidase [Gemmatimonadaceae bacterium]
MSHRLLKCAVFAFALVSIRVAAHAQPVSDPSQLTLARIFSSREFAPKFLDQSQWLDDSAYTTIEPTPQGKGSELIAYDPATGARRILVTAQILTPMGTTMPLEMEDYKWSEDHSRLLVFTNSARVWRANTRGDFWVLDIATKSLKKMGGPDAKPQTLQFAKFSPDGKRVAYVRENNLYAENISDNAITPLTKDGSRTTINGTFDWVYEEELSLRDGFRWSPDGKSIAYWQVDASGVRDFLLIDDTDSLYSFTKAVQYPKAGTTNSSVRIGVVNAAGGNTTWLAIPGDPRNNYLARMDWAANSTDVLVEQLDRRQQVNTFYLGNAATGKATVAMVDRDSAWVDVTDGYSDYGDGPSVWWINSGREFMWLSDRDGWSHVWASTRTGTLRLVTSAPHDVISVVRVDAKGGWLYYMASPDNATQRFLYRTKLDGTAKAERVTPAGISGTHAYDMSPNGVWALHQWSSFGVPPKNDIVQMATHKSVRVLVDNAQLEQRLAAIAKSKPEFFKVNVDGHSLDGWMIKPPNFDSTRKYPVLFYVYGEPAATTVNDAYAGSQYLWYLMLAQEGYIVASVDNRGTPAPKGRAWRKALRNASGAVRVRDQSEAARIIAQRSYVDPKRIGVWGWSGGGSSTLLLMFRAPDTYRMGMSVAPVADVHNYDTIYQERYVGLPSTDSAAYRDASAVYFAGGLKGDLLVVHGTGDDNVHYQGTEQLINALIAQNKPFQMMAYPNRTHGIFEGPGTTRHLYELLTSYLKQHLPVGTVMN